MKKILLLSLSLLTINVFSQQFRLDADARKKLGKIDKELLNKVLFTEHFLDNQFDPELGLIRSYINSSNLSNKQLESFNKLVCLDCYAKEWQTIQMNMKEAKDIKYGKNDSIQNIAFLQSLNNLDSIQVLTVANEINSLANNAFKLYDDRERNNIRILRFFPANYSLEEFEAKYKSTGIYSCNDCMTIKFTYVFDGSNPDLNIKGTKLYKFNSVNASYLQLYPFWKKYVTPNLTKEELLSSDNYNSRWYKNPYYDINIRFWKNDIWFIENY